MPARVAVSIGIKTSGRLPELPGALTGAHDFAGWAKTQGYEVHLVTDENGQPVTLLQLKTLIKGIVNAGEAERLLIYFAGHGTQPTFNAPFWLLSGWEEDSDEAVNVNLSFANAKRSGIAQIAIFADACRSNVTGGSTIGGGTIFPKAVASAGGHTEWDHFYSTRLGEEAQEVGGANPTLAYGIFTNCALQALKGELPQAAESRQGHPPVQVVTSQSLTRYLREAVPLESGRTPGAAVQFPDINPGWLQPNDIYFRLPPPSVMESALESLTQFGRTISSVLKDGITVPTIGEATPDPARKAVAQARARDDKAVAARESTITAAQGRETFETRQGLSIVGAKVAETRMRQNQPVDLFEENGAFHVRGHHNAPQTVLLRLDNGNWIGTAIIPEFVGTIVIEGGVAVSTRYLAARTSSRYFRGEYEPETPVLARWSALMSQGRTADAKELERAADKLREGKHSDPSLGILATYAYERAGRIAEIDSIAGYFARAGQPVPYDVAMLSTHSMIAHPGGLTIQPADAPIVAVAGTFPLMTEGWTFLDPEDSIVPRELLALRRGLLPSLWATFRPAEGTALAHLVDRGIV